MVITAETSQQFFGFDSPATRSPDRAKITRPSIAPPHQPEPTNSPVDRAFDRPNGETAKNLSNIRTIFSTNSAKPAEHSCNTDSLSC
ncbi:MULTISPECIES: hypothetical protein [unclassified Microcoleus]|uniref:hypothetical protein n=1 Tax=unclassified Microcoleus TaxID=2642155 RepID=UPI001E112423|nr:MULTISPECIES: hypothetical protein [unclassified Microcoleus]MCC3595802.1 hypothetical protein [Microcoleus sp. PH2017_26_ELK_O_A]MCC3620604.1 hypothetical protein [Microcoleus sp. PH2017_36_ELK_O_B]